MKIQIGNIAGILGMALFAAACSIDDAEKLPLVKLGAVQKEYLVEAEGVSINIPVYSNNPYHIERIEESEDWLLLTIPENTSSNSYICAECSFNKEFKRRGRFVLCSDVDSRRDTVTIKQKGLLEASLSMDNLSVVLAGAGGENVSEIRTNIPFSYMDVSVKYIVVLN